MGRPLLSFWGLPAPATRWGCLDPPSEPRGPRPQHTHTHARAHTHTHLERPHPSGPGSAWSSDPARPQIQLKEGRVPIQVAVTCLPPPAPATSRPGPLGKKHSPPRTGLLHPGRSCPHPQGSGGLPASHPAPPAVSGGHTWVREAPDDGGQGGPGGRAGLAVATGLLSAEVRTAQRPPPPPKLRH